jgi:hypothetical protein
MKYRPDFPERFGEVEDARGFCGGFFPWYNDEHHHASLGMLTPADVHHGLVEQRVAERQAVLDAAFAEHPERRTGDILSIIATCIAHDINPRAYLHRVVHCIVHGWPQAQIRDLLPDRMLAAYPELFAGDPDALPIPTTARALAR